MSGSGNVGLELDSRHDEIQLGNNEDAESKPIKYHPGFYLGEGLLTGAGDVYLIEADGRRHLFGTAFIVSKSAIWFQGAEANTAYIFLGYGDTIERAVAGIPTQID